MPAHRLAPALALALALGALALAAPAAASAADPRPAPAGPRRTVVILHSIPPDLPGLHELSSALGEGLQRGGGAPADLYAEYTGLDRFSGADYEQALLRLYELKYAARQVDLLVAVGPVALEFAVSHRLLPGTPIVTCYVARRLVEAARGRRPALTGALPAQNAPRTAELMLSMFPATRRIHVVLGGSEYERGQAQQGRLIFAPFAGRAEFEYLNDLTLEQIEARVAALPEDELVLYGSMLQDAGGRDFSTNEALARISAASRRPVFGVIYEDLGAGILGGNLVSMERSGRTAAELGARVLAGEPAGAIPLVADAGLAPMFDWRQLHRFGIPARRLPEGSLVQFREPGLWETHGRAISAGVGVMALERLLVAGLMLQLRRRRKVERALAGAETRYRTVADFTHDWEFWRRTDGSFEYVSPACDAALRPSAGGLQARPRAAGAAHPRRGPPGLARQPGRGAGGREQAPLEFRIRTRGGEVRWVRQASNPVRLDDGQPAGTRGSIGDITDRKLGELDLQGAYEEIRALKDRLEAENTYYREKIQQVEGPSELLGQSDPMKYLFYRIRQVAPSDTTVLIQGETGTGKELVAEAIHGLGPRADRPLVKINCAALPPTLAESELFGHEKGAFTGASALRKGRFELADGATLFLDEVGAIRGDGLVLARLLGSVQVLLPADMPPYITRPQVSAKASRYW